MTRFDKQKIKEKMRKISKKELSPEKQTELIYKYFN